MAKFAAVFFLVKIILVFFARSIPALFVAQSVQALSFAVLIPATVRYVDETLSPADANKGQAYATATMTDYIPTDADLAAGFAALPKMD